MTYDKRSDPRHRVPVATDYSIAPNSGWVVKWYCQPPPLGLPFSVNFTDYSTVKRSDHGLTWMYRWRHNPTPDGYSRYARQIRLGNGNRAYSVMVYVRDL